MNEQELAALAAQMVTMQQQAAGGGLDVWDALADLGVIKGVEALAGGVFYLVILWACNGDHALGRFLFRYSDEVALDEANARHEDPAIHLPARGNLARVNAARIIGFAIVIGCILAF